MFLLPLLAILFVYILALLISKHIGRGIIFSLLCAFVFCIIYYTRPSGILRNILFFFLLSVITIIYLIIQSKIKYDFMNKIYTCNYFINKAITPKLVHNSNGIKYTNRIVGNVIPYTNGQLKHNGKYITMNDQSTAGITLISGATGSGKTYAIESYIEQNIVAGDPVVYCEYKGDPEAINELSEFGEQYGYYVLHLSSGISDFNYDPLQNLNNTGRIDAIINMRKWSIDGSDNYYKVGMQKLLQKTMKDFANIYNSEIKTGKKVYGYSNPNSFTLSYYEYLKKYNCSKDEWEHYENVKGMLELLLTSTFENMFLGKEKKTLDFHKIKNEKFLLIVSFVSSNKDLATSFSSLLIRDLLDECTNYRPNKNIYLYVDESGTLTNPLIFKDVLEKGRGAKIATTMSFLDINQIVIQSNEAYLNSILGIVNTFIVFSGTTRQTAEKLAGVQLLEIEPILMNLRKPINGKPPTAIFMTKYPSLNKKINFEVLRFEPYIINKNNNLITANDNSKVKNIIESENVDNKQSNENNEEGLTLDEILANRQKKDELKKYNINNKNENIVSKGSINILKDQNDIKNVNESNADNSNSHLFDDFI